MTKNEFNKHLCSVDTQNYAEFTITVFDALGGFCIDKSSNEDDKTALLYELRIVLEVMDTKLPDYTLLSDLHSKLQTVVL